MKTYDVHAFAIVCVKVKGVVDVEGDTDYLESKWFNAERVITNFEDV